MAALRPWIVPGLGAVALVAGVTVWLWPRPSAIGWFAYAPLADTEFVGMMPDYTLVYALAIGLVLIGVALLAGWAGFRLGRRPAR